MSYQTSAGDRAGHLQPNKERQLPKSLPSPQEWLQSQGNVLLVPAVREIAPSVATWLVIEAICNGGNELDGIASVIALSDPKVNATMTLKEWINGVSQSLIQFHGSSKKAYIACIEKHWGKIVTVVHTKKGTQVILNDLPFTAWCAGRLRLWYDARESAFYQYSTNEGVWEYVAEVEIRRKLLEFLREGEIPEATFSLGLVGLVVRNLPVLALYESTAIDPRPIHSQNAMVHFLMTGPSKELTTTFSPAYFSKNRIPVDYDHSKRCTQFHNFLNESLSEEDRDLLQLWCGFVLLGINPYHRILLIRGIPGAGKSTLIDIIEAIIGRDNVATLNVERLDDRFELSAFRDKTLLVAKDVGSDVLKSKAAHALKALSGDQGIEAEMKHENRRFRLQGPFNIAITSNSDLEIGIKGDLGAWKRRLLVLDFEKKPSKPVPNLSRTIIDGEAEGIFYWMVLGARNAATMIKGKKKWELTPLQIGRISRLLEQSDNILSFVGKHVEKGTPDSFISTAELYESYESYCNEYAYNPEPISVFSRRIKALFFAFFNARYTTRAPEDTKATKDSEGASAKSVKPLRGYAGIELK